MKSIFETCRPRQDVLEGELKHDKFAASLSKVIFGKAEQEYLDASIFFDNTFPTSGLKELLVQALSRLVPSKGKGNPVIRLETSFGGGKTHNLIALYHLAKAGIKGTTVKDFVDPKLIPSDPIKNVVGLVGPDLEVMGIQHDDLVIRTPWGEIAYQIGGPAGYELIRKADEQGIAPGTPTWEKIIGDSPTLIMIDEVAAYLRNAKALKVGDSNMAKQTVSFLMALLKFASEKDRVVVVLTLADSQDAFGEESDELREELDKELGEAKSISSRTETIITPAEGDEISAIVTHRLFKKVDRNAAEQTAEAYSKYYNQQMEQNVDLPQRSIRAEYAQEIAKDYPFHPDLLNALTRKVATIPNFQKTRGALRLLATVVKKLWTDKPEGTELIHPFHVDLSVESIANDLTSRLNKQSFQQVIESDIISPRKGTPSKAQEIDLEFKGSGKPPYAQRVATTVFLHSITRTSNLGIEPADLRLAVLQPGDEPGFITKAIERLNDTGWYFDYDGHLYTFKTEPSLNKIIADEMNLVNKFRAKETLDERIRGIWKKGIFETIPFPVEAAEVDDNSGKPKLAIIHYDAASCEATDTTPPELVQKLFEHAGSMEGYRVYKNNVLFLVADKEQMDRMVENVRRLIAIDRITEDNDRFKSFSQEQQKKLKDLRNGADLDVRISVHRTYKYLFYPSADAGKKNANLSCQILPPQDQGSVSQDQANVLLRLLKELGKVLTADDSSLPAKFIKAKAWPTNAEQISTDDLRQEFAKRLALKILLSPDLLKKSIRDGISKGEWIYYSTEERLGYNENSPIPLIEISEDAILYTVAEAARVNLKIKGDQTEDNTCPACGQDPCACPVEPTKKLKKPILADGAPSQAFQKISDICSDQKVKKLRKLFLKIEGSNKSTAKDMSSIGLAVPQFGKGSFKVEQDIVAEFGPGENFSLKFCGSWDRYKGIKAMAEKFGQEASSVKVNMTLSAEFGEGLPLEGDQFSTMRDVLDQLGVGKLFLSAEPEPEKSEGE